MYIVHIRLHNVTELGDCKILRHNKVTPPCTYTDYKKCNSDVFICTKIRQCSYELDVKQYNTQY